MKLGEEEKKKLNNDKRGNKKRGGVYAGRKERRKNMWTSIEGKKVTRNNGGIRAGDEGK